MILVTGTREGLIGGKTASGYLIDTVVPFVALPSAAALRQWVVVYNPATGLSTAALVLDVGPWNEQDQPYVFQGLTMWPMRPFDRNNLPTTSQIETFKKGIRPAAERGIDTRGRKTNGAGIDLGEAVWGAIGMTDNGPVGWEFIQ